MAPNNPLPIHGNEKTMNLNHLILTNIQSSPYFKVNLYELKTYHEVIDEIYYKVSHLEPWEKGSRKTAGQTGMCGGVRGVGAGGIVSSAFCLLYKLFTLRLTRKQVMGLCNHTDSPYIRGLGFMYIRYTQNPADFWDWYEEYLEDDEEIDVKAGGGHSVKIGDMLKQWLTKLEWYSTLFPRIPVPVQKSIEQKLTQYELAHPKKEEFSDKGFEADHWKSAGRPRESSPARNSPATVGSSSNRRPTPPFDIAKEFEKEPSRKRSRSRERHRDRHRSRSRERRRSKSRERKRSRDRKRSRSRERKRDKRSRSRDKGSHHKHRHRSRSRERHRSRSREKHSRSYDKRYRSRSRDRQRESSFERDLRKLKEKMRRREDH